MKMMIRFVVYYRQVIFNVVEVGTICLEFANMEFHQPVSLGRTITCFLNNIEVIPIYAGLLWAAFASFSPNHS